MHGLLRKETEPSAIGQIRSNALKNHFRTSSGVSFLFIVHALYYTYTQESLFTFSTPATFACNGNSLPLFAFHLHGLPLYESM